MDLSKILNPQGASYIPSPDKQISCTPSVRLPGPEPNNAQYPFIHDSSEISNYPGLIFQTKNTATLPSPVTPEGLNALNIARHDGRLLPSPSQSPLSLSTETYQVPASFDQTYAHTNMPHLEPKCEFSDGPCVTGGENLRKVISHIFGRNKNCTKLFPQHVWIHYCRKHYQRARYRASVWPFTQCDLLMDSLDRMEAWGGVDSFELVLRRRETRRTKIDNDGESNEQNISSTSGFPSPEVSSPNSVVSFSQASAIQTQEGGNTTNENLSKKPPYIPPSPVPDWLREEVGPNKSFNDIRDIMTRLREYMAMVQAMDEKVMFPDIEILPRFRPGLIIAENDRTIAPRDTMRTGASPVPVFQEPGILSRVSRKGGIQKYARQ
ncbi:hypothetical protein DTO271D3_2179 [Paecilomyces variotii]|nr:hypothetical protein DTO271D3_2179 [Paecilomyces variotii]KAJ9392049.1 hypothetical protein DTO063F5_808 [Paecilomyces variotii]